ncbi:MAG: hypothetical protein RL701_44, partial [Pseudomonadota bacterium]
RAAKALGLHRNQVRRWLVKRSPNAATDPPLGAREEDDDE